MRAAEAREPAWLVGVVGLAMLYLGTWAVIVAAAAWWPLALLLGAGLALAAWRMQASRDARSLRIILLALGALSVAAGAFVALTGAR